VRSLSVGGRVFDAVSVADAAMGLGQTTHGHDPGGQGTGDPALRQPPATYETGSDNAQTRIPFHK
jgi:hypothetical protein